MRFDLAGAISSWRWSFVLRPIIVRYRIAILLIAIRLPNRRIYRYTMCEPLISMGHSVGRHSAMTPILWLLLAAAAVGATGFWYSWKRRRPKP